MTTSFFYFLAYIALLVAGGYAVTRRWDDAPPTALMLNTESMNGLTERYNDAIRELEREYDSSHDDSFWSRGGSSGTKRLYSKRYEALAGKYKQERLERLRQWKESHPLWAKARKVWGWIFVIGMVSAAVMCQGTMVADDAAQSAPSAVMGSSGEVKYWNAQNIPIPYLQDSTQYVSNPDGVLSQSIVDSMNVILQRIEQHFDIQTVAVVVNHIENDDPFRMAQDLGNSYGVGRRDRGLVIVVGYEDHSINISPGRSLEADLTDVECNRLERQYVVPAMRAEMPDSAMLYLTKALYATMQKKELPQMTSLFDSDDDDFGLAKTMGLYMLFIIGWAMFFSRMNRKYQWLGLLGASKLLSNPFYEESGGGGVFVGGGGGGFGGGGGGGFGGGHFGGGSFGGGGATSRW